MKVLRFNQLLNNSFFHEDKSVDIPFFSFPKGNRRKLSKKEKILNSKFLINEEKISFYKKQYLNESQLSSQKRTLKINSNKKLNVHHCKNQTCNKNILYNQGRTFEDKIDEKYNYRSNRINNNVHNRKLNNTYEIGSVNLPSIGKKKIVTIKEISANSLINNEILYEGKIINRNKFRRNTFSSKQ